MKHLYFIGGTMGVGKTTTCQVLKGKLERSVMLDGDWCWDMHPFVVSEETKQMVMDNICYLLNNFIRCSTIEHIVFCWVLHEQAIMDDILSRVDTSTCQVHFISLTCDEQALTERLQQDIHLGYRLPDVLQRSLERLPLYAQLRTYKVDVSSTTPEQAAEVIIQYAKR